MRKHKTIFVKLTTVYYGHVDTIGDYMDISLNYRRHFNRWYQYNNGFKNKELKLKLETYSLRVLKRSKYFVKYGFFSRCSISTSVWFDPDDCCRMISMLRYLCDRAGPRVLVCAKCLDNRKTFRLANMLQTSAYSGVNVENNVLIWKTN